MAIFIINKVNWRYKKGRWHILIIFHNTQFVTNTWSSGFYLNLKSESSLSAAAAFITTEFLYAFMTKIYMEMDGVWTQHLYGRTTEYLMRKHHMWLFYVKIYIQPHQSKFRVYYYTIFFKQKVITEYFSWKNRIGSFRVIVLICI